MALRTASSKIASIRAMTKCSAKGHPPSKSSIIFHDLGDFETTPPDRGRSCAPRGLNANDGIFSFTPTHRLDERHGFLATTNLTRRLITLAFDLAHSKCALLIGCSSPTAVEKKRTR